MISLKAACDIAKVYFKKYDIGDIKAIRDTGDKWVISGWKDNTVSYGGGNMVFVMKNTGKSGIFDDTDINELKAYYAAPMIDIPA